MKRLLAFILMLGLVTGCHTTRTATEPAPPHLRVLTYNVNWGDMQPVQATEIIRQSGAEIVCLQETTPQSEQYFRQALAGDYQFLQFRYSRNRMGGGLGFLAKVPEHEVSYIPSETGWFDGWIMKFNTAIGPVQILTVHLRPPVSDDGSWVSGYFTTRGDRLREMEKFYAQREPQTPMLVLGDFNDGESSRTVHWLEGRGMVNALPQFDNSHPTWKWKLGWITLKRRLDHVLYSSNFDCAAARIIPSGISDHYPVEAVFTTKTANP